MAMHADALSSSELDALGACASRLVHVLKAHAVFVLDFNGQLLASAGRVEALDVFSIVSLSAAMMAAVSGLASLVGETDFRQLSFDGAERSLHFRRISHHAILVTSCDSNTPLGLVRLWCNRIGDELLLLLDERERVDGIHSGGPTSLGVITDADIENLFAL